MLLIGALLGVAPKLSGHQPIWLIEPSSFHCKNSLGRTKALGASTNLAIAELLGLASQAIGLAKDEKS